MTRYIPQIILLLSMLACSIQSQAPIHTSPPIRQYEHVLFTPAFIRHNFETFRLAPQIDAQRQAIPTEDK